MLFSLLNFIFQFIETDDMGNNDMGNDMGSISGEFSIGKTTR